MKTLAILTFLAAPLMAHGVPVNLSWTDNSNNEDGFEMRARLPDQSWEVVGITTQDVSTMSVESSTHDAWQVYAFVFGWEGSKIYSENGTNVLVKPSTPESPSNLTPPEQPRQASHRHRYRRHAQ